MKCPAAVMIEIEKGAEKLLLSGVLFIVSVIQSKNLKILMVENLMISFVKSLLSL
mgnify:CR=1 FL=1